MVILVDGARACSLRDAVGPSILLPDTRHGRTFLVTESDPPMVVFLDGEHAHHGFEKERASNWSGVSIGPVRICVELDSIYSTSEIGPQLGSIVLRENSPNIVARVKEGAWTETRLLPIGGGEIVAKGRTVSEVGFTSWQAVIFENQISKVIFGFGLKPSGAASTHLP